MKIAVRVGRTAAVVAGAVVCGAVALPTIAKADSGDTAECPAARVTGLSSALDTVGTAAAAGPSIAFGIVLVPLSQPLPPPFDVVQSQVLAGAADGVQQLRADAPGYVEQLRAGIAPFAAGNDVANQGVSAVADTLDTVADTAGPAIAPADRTLHETATIVRSNAEVSASC